MSILSAPAAYQPSLAGLSTILGSEKEKEQEPEVIDLTAPGPKKSKKPTARPPVTPQKSRHVTGLNTPPPSNQSDQDVTRKRARSGTLTPTPTDRGGSSKRPKLDTEPKSSPNTEKQMNDTVASGSAPEDQRAAQPPHHTNGCERQPDPLINRHTVTIHNGHPEHDPSIFSIKPFQWNEWNEHDYFALSEFLMQGFNAEEFARQRTANSATGRVFTTEEAHYVMRAVVARPLRLMEQNTKRGKEGMMQLANYYKRFGAPIRMWAKGSQYQTRGEIAGIKDMSVHLMLETPSETDGSMASGETRAEIPITTLTNDDWWTLKDCASDNDIKVLRAWRNELNLPKLGPRATQAGASSGTA